jgi:hypothetical protein
LFDHTVQRQDNRVSSMGAQGCQNIRKSGAMQVDQVGPYSIDLGGQPR